MSQKHTSWVVKKNEINAVVTRWGAITPQVDVIRLRHTSETRGDP
jgi:hypothetical protein